MSAPTHHLPKQVPDGLRRLDDPYGIVWRLVNLWRHTSLTRTLRFVEGLAANPAYERPLFIVGMPRSGSTLLFHLLRESEALGALPREGHDLWRLFHHPRYTGWDGDAVGSGAVRPLEPRVVRAWFYAYVGRRRFVEKTADNVVRVPYLLDLFPDARFLVIKRDPLNVVNSYINGWNHPEGRFRSYYVPEDLSIPGYPHRRQWCSTLIDGWRDYVSAPVPEIAFAQWRQYVEAIDAARGAVPPAQWRELHFEHVLQRPDDALDALCAFAEIPATPALRARLHQLVDRPVNALSPPDREKWRRQNPDALQALLPRMAPLAASLGYELDARTGVVRVPPIVSSFFA